MLCRADASDLHRRPRWLAATLVRNALAKSAIWRQAGAGPLAGRFFEHADGVALVAARTSADWFHELVVPNAQTLLFPNGKTKFVRPSDGSIGNEPGTGVVLIGMGEIANAALEGSGLGFFVRVGGAA